MKTPIETARYMCNTIMSEYKPNDLPGLKDRYHYIQALFLFAIQRYAKISGDEKCFDYIKEWVDTYIDENGNILNQHDMLDEMYPSVLLFDIYQRTNEKRYKIALDTTVDRLVNWKFNEYGSFYHMYKTPNQVWLDGLFMAGLLLTEYGRKYNRPELFNLMARQAKNMYDHMRKADTGMYLHAWDCTKEAEWANKQTGLSSECWARSMGWVAFALCDMLENIPQSHSAFSDMKKQLIELLDGLIKYQDKQSGMWYQVPDKMDFSDNWVETSASCLFAYAMHKAARLGIGNVDKYKKCADTAYEGIMNSTKESDDGTLIIPNICVGTNVTDYEGYISRPRRDNDSHGTGAFILMCCEFSM